MSENLAHTLRERLATFRDSMHARAQETIFAHLYQGADLTAGAIRLSEYWFDPGSELSVPQRTKRTREKDVFSDHIKVFGRESTLLTWMVKWRKAEHENDLRTLVLIEQQPANDANLVCEATREPDWATTVIKISSGLNDALCPTDLIEHYLSGYLLNETPRQGDERVYRELFVAARGGALAAMNEMSRQELRLMAAVLRKEGTAARTPSDYSSLLLLGALQSVLVFAHLSEVSKRSNRPIVAYLTAGGPKEPLWITLRNPAKSMRSDEHEQWFEAQAAARDIAWKDIQEKAAAPRAASSLADRLLVSQVFSGSYDKREEFIAASEKEIREQFEVDALTEWRVLLVVWMVAIIDRLRGELHESQRLDFYLAAGDASQVLDSASFVLRTLDAKVKEVAVPEGDVRGDQKTLKKAVDDAVRAIGRLNYPWFQDGRYALFWDVTFPASAPVGLLELRHSTWERWDSRLELGLTELGEDASFVVASCRGDGRAGLSIGPAKLLVAAPGQRRWELSSRQGRATWLQDWLQGTADQKRVLANVLLRIAEDPRRGCMMVFPAPAGKTVYPSMGDVWKPTEPIRIASEYEEDLIALCSMDGATIVGRDPNSGDLVLEYRRLVGSYDAALLQALETLISSEKSPLLGMGSRRWAGALTAASEQVAAVIVVSQDGDIHVWQRKNGRLTLFGLRLGEATPENLVDLSLTQLSDAAITQLKASSVRAKRPRKPRGSSGSSRPHQRSY
jgi:hypothetical protein